jgi:Spy/CpxP family protein refolding chaperone
MRLIALTAALLWSTVALAQHHQPYSGQEQREIKSLSESEMKGYLEGAGMGYAKAAELNGYPGPMHVLELSDQLGLKPDQKLAMRSLMDSHKAEARTLGARVVESERELERLFRRGNFDADALAKAVAEAARLQGEYRLAHLETHRRALGVLSPEQVSKYSELRGYVTNARHIPGAS